MVERRDKPGLTHQMAFTIPDELVEKWEIGEFYNSISQMIDINEIRMSALGKFDPNWAPCLHYALANYCLDPNEGEFGEYQRAIDNYRKSYVASSLYLHDDDRAVELYNEVERQEKILKGWTETESPLLPLARRFMNRQFAFRFGSDLVETFNAQLLEWSAEAVSGFSPFQSTDPMETPNFGNRATGIPFQAFLVNKMLQEINYSLRKSKNGEMAVLSDRWKVRPAPLEYAHFEDSLNDLEHMFFGRITGSCFGTIV
jgi:hypothetical protein